jgi:hypothetical protein
MAEHTHEYDCIVCGAHFDDSQTLAKHNEREHLKNATGMERPRLDTDKKAPENDKLDPSAEL